MYDTSRTLFTFPGIFTIYALTPATIALTKIMRLIYISSSTIPSRAANSVHVMKMCQAFSALGFDVILLAPNRKGKETGVVDVFRYYGVRNCFKIKQLPFPASIKGKTFIYSFLTAFWCRRMNADLVYSRDLIAAYFSCLFRLNTVFESHNPIEKQRRSLFSFAFTQIACSKFLKKLVVISQYLESSFINNYGSLEKKILCCPDAADPIPENIKPNLLPKKEYKLLVGYLGHLYKGRGVDLIIEMAAKTKQVEYHLVGGAEKDIKKWKEHAKDLQNVIFHGFVSPGSLYQYMLSFDVLLAPYQKQVTVSGGGGNTGRWMSPLKIFEYMAAGKIILASRLPALNEVLSENIDCIMADPEDLNEWVEKITDVQLKKEKYQRLGVNAKRVFSEKYTWLSRAKHIISSL